MATDLKPLAREQEVALAYQRARWGGASQTLAYHRALAEFRRLHPNAPSDDASSTVFQIITAAVRA